MHASEALMARDGGQVGVDGNDVVAALGEFLEEHHAEFMGVVGNADDGEAFLSEKIMDGVERGLWAWHAALLEERLSGWPVEALSMQKEEAACL